MSEITSSSFIPKRKANGLSKPVGHRNIFILSIVSYALFIAAPVAAATVFIYQKYTDKNFQQNVINLDTAIKSFNEADMLRVLDFHERLKFSNQIFNSQVSLSSLLNILEQSTVKTVKFNSLKISQAEAGSLLAEAELSADSFDAVIFQRSQYENNQSLASSSFTNLIFTPPNSETTKDSKATDNKPIKLTTKFVFTKDNILSVTSTATPTSDNNTVSDLEVASSSLDLSLPADISSQATSS